MVRHVSGSGCHLFIFADQVIAEFRFNRTCHVSGLHRPRGIIESFRHHALFQCTQFAARRCGFPIAGLPRKRIKTLSVLNPLDEFAGQLFGAFLCAGHFRSGAYCTGVRNENMARFDLLFRLL